MESENSPNQMHWFAVTTRSRHEKVANHSLLSQGIETFLPFITEVHKWSDRKREVAVPLFSCYVFVQIPDQNALFVKVLRTPGVVNFVSNRGTPIPIADKEIAEVQSVLSHRLDCSAYPFLRVGQRVRIVGGALDQIEGTLIGQGADSKLVISIELIQRSIAISTYDLCVEPVHNIRSTANIPHSLSSSQIQQTRLF